MASKSGRKLVADANVLLAAAARRAAVRVLTAPGIEILTVPATLDEVIEYASDFAERFGLTEEEMLESVHALPLMLAEEPVYASGLREAKRLIGARDPDDIPLLALALALELPVWTNDKHFKELGVTTYTTAQLLKALGFSSARHR